MSKSLHLKIIKAPHTQLKSPHTKLNALDTKLKAPQKAPILIKRRKMFGHEKLTWVW